MGVVVAFRQKVEECDAGEDDAELDLFTAVDVAIRDLREIVLRWGEPAGIEQADACREMLERVYRAAL
ncbi:hypothetical protein [Bauldia litoralis]|uniref:hypothetical protein n=1 Tax=Bauldia litoralis TaxID=665467 RepID=UPI000B84A776|nr:hypothetical protein [Bauldia litoralis]